ncbi:hypothetical protein BX592_12575 [Paraburkholderia rhizosphaerae]|uniref:Uncharacterized protein n=1 Tax=Paraburkholderia rhizosphaerae TaxID=480658 RepID=A0A4R8LBY1_9BURK|nr:hypothetical protein BX592_12575 [Paraburkholderia rhizosphaerae]
MVHGRASLRPSMGPGLIAITRWPLSAIDLAYLPSWAPVMLPFSGLADTVTGIPRMRDSVNSLFLFGSSVIFTPPQKSLPLASLSTYHT